MYDNSETITFIVMIVFRELAQMARARGLGPRGREFESRVPEIMPR